MDPDQKVTFWEGLKPFITPVGGIIIAAFLMYTQLQVLSNNQTVLDRSLAGIERKFDILVDRVDYMEDTLIRLTVELALKTETYPTSPPRSPTPQTRRP